MENINEKKEKNNEMKLLELPDYLINNYIFPYISNKELFIIVRKVHPYLNKIIIESLGDNYKEEIKLKLLIEKENIKKEYENKMRQIINIRNLLLFNNLNINMLEILKLCVDYLNNENILKLIIVFSEIFFEEDLMGTLLDDNIKIEDKKNLLLEIINNENTLNEFVIRLAMILDIDNYTENELFSGLKIMFSQIDYDNVENINNNCRLLIIFLQRLFHFQDLKIESCSLKLKAEVYP